VTPQTGQKFLAMGWISTIMIGNEKEGGAMRKTTEQHSIIWNM